MTRTARLLNRVNRESLAGLSFSNVEELGGNAIHYLAANAPEGEDFGGSIEADRPSRPWTVVVRAGEAEGEIVVEGFGESLERPLYSERVVIRGPSR